MLAVDVGAVWPLKLASLDAHVSQFYEWLPWVDGNLEGVPAEADARMKWLGENWRFEVSEPVS